MLYGREGVYSMLFKVNVEACSCSKQNYCLAGVGYICMHACICTCTCTWHTYLFIELGPKEVALHVHWLKCYGLGEVEHCLGSISTSQ